MSMIPIGWDCYNAMNAQVPTPQGGRVFSMQSMPVLYQNSYYDYHGATRTDQSHKLLIDVLTWLGGGRTNLTVGVSPDPIDLNWYTEGENGLTVGTRAKAAMTNAGFSVIDYGPQKTADNFFATADIVILDNWINSYTTGSPAGQISVAESANIHNYVMTQDKAILYLYDAHSSTGFGFNSTYAWQVGMFQLYGYSGSEAIFDRAFSGSQTFGVHLWGGRTAVAAAAAPANPSHGLTYPSTKLAGWRNATMSTHYPVFAAFSAHEDIGSLGDAWA